MSDDLKDRLLANALDECDEAVDRIAALEAEKAELALQVLAAQGQAADAVMARAAAYARALEDAAGIAHEKHDAAMKWASTYIKDFDGKTDSLSIAVTIRSLPNPYAPSAPEVEG